MHLIRLVFSHLAGSYLLYWHNCGVVTNSRQPTPTWPGFPAILQRRSGRNQLPGSYSEWTHPLRSLTADPPGVDGPTPGTLQRVRPAAGVRCPADPLKSPQQYPREVLLHAGVGKNDIAVRKCPYSGAHSPTDRPSQCGEPHLSLNPPTARVKPR